MPAARRSWSRAEEDAVIALIKLCSTPQHLQQVHAYLLLHGQSQNNYLAAKLVRTFSELGWLQHARRIADSITTPNVFVWSSIIRGYSDRPEPHFRFQDSFLLYSRMRRCIPAVEPLNFTISSVLKACARGLALGEGMQVHAHALKHGFQLDAVVQTTLINLYGKCRRLVHARKVFDKMLKGGVKDLQAWNTMIARYAEVAEMETARDLFEKMPEWNVFTVVEMIGGYTAIGQMEQARRMFDLCLAPGDKNAVACTAMITGYAKWGDIAAARLVFDEIHDRDVASWNAMITAYAHANLSDEALILFRSMQKTNVKPNETTIATVASACAQLGSPNIAKCLQDYVDNRGLELLNSHTVAALIDLHAKCGNLGKAHDLFVRWHRKDLICYSSMISAFGVHGHGKDAMQVFNDLQKAGLKPDSICFVLMLTACSHAGMVQQGRQYLESMTEEHHIVPTAEHYMCMVDLLGRAGLVEDAYRLITSEMASKGIQPHAGVWGALLSACRSHGNVEVAEAAARHLIKQEPDNAGNYVLLSNTYANARRWDGVVQMRALMRTRGLKKPPGVSWVEVDGGSGGSRVQKFLTGDVFDAQLELMLEMLSWELKAQGYVPANLESE